MIGIARGNFVVRNRVNAIGFPKNFLLTKNS